MQAINEVIQRGIIAKKVSNSIKESMGRFGRVSDDDARFLANADAKVVMKIEGRLALPKTGQVESLIENFGNRGHCYCHGKTKIETVQHLHLLAQFGHFDLFDQIPGHDPHKVCLYIEHGINDRVELSKFESEHLQWFLKSALISNNTPIIDKLLNEHGLTIDSKRHRHAIVDSDNPELLRFLPELSQDEVEDMTLDAVYGDRIKMFQHLYPGYEKLKINRYELLATVVNCGAVKILAFLLQEDPSIDLVRDVFDEEGSQDRPDLHRILLDGNERLIELVLTNIDKFN